MNSTPYSAHIATENSNTLLSTDHPLVRSPQNKWLIFFIGIIPLIVHFVNFSSRTENFVWYFNIAIELGIMLLSILLGFGLMILTHRIFNRNLKQSQRYAVPNYFRKMESSSSTIILLLFLGLTLSSDLIEFTRYFVNLGFITVLSLLYSNVFVLILLYQLKKSGTINLIKTREIIMISHEFVAWKFNVSFQKEFDNTEIFTVIIMNLIKANHGILNKSLEYESVTFADLDEGQKNISIYTPINDSEWVLVAYHQDYMSIYQFLNELAEIVDLEGKMVSLSKPNDNFYDFYEGSIVSTKSRVTEQYDLFEPIDQSV